MTAVSSMSNTDFIRTGTLIIRDTIRANVTDPLSTARPAGQSFVLTGYPDKPVVYPIITVIVQNAETTQYLGMQSEMYLMELSFELRVWARNVKERDQLASQVMNHLRDVQLDPASGGNPLGGTRIKQLHDPVITSSVNVDDPGAEGVKSRVTTMSYKFIFGAT